MCKSWIEFIQLLLLFLSFFFSSSHSCIWLIGVLHIFALLYFFTIVLIYAIRVVKALQIECNATIEYQVKLSVFLFSSYIDVF